jgi:hypothetical protein
LNTVTIVLQKIKCEKIKNFRNKRFYEISLLWNSASVTRKMPNVTNTDKTFQSTGCILDAHMARQSMGWKLPQKKKNWMLITMCTNKLHLLHNLVQRFYQNNIPFHSTFVNVMSFTHIK